MDIWLVGTWKLLDRALVSLCRDQQWTPALIALEEDLLKGQADGARCSIRCARLTTVTVRDGYAHLGDLGRDARVGRLPIRRTRSDAVATIADQRDV